MDAACASAGELQRDIRKDTATIATMTSATSRASAMCCRASESS
jgi:hypothetical protein